MPVRSQSEPEPAPRLVWGHPTAERSRAMGHVIDARILAVLLVGLAIVPSALVFTLLLAIVPIAFAPARLIDPLKGTERGLAILSGPRRLGSVR